MLKSKIYHLAFALNLIAATLLHGCSHPPDEERIRNLLDEVIQTLEAREYRFTLNRLTENFSGPNNMNKAQIRQMMLGTLLRYKSIHIVKSSPLDIQIRDNSAIVKFQTTVTGGPGVFPQRVQNYSVSTGWTKIDGDWYILQATWTTQ